MATSEESAESGIEAQTDTLERAPLDPDRVTLRQRIQGSWPARLGLTVLLAVVLVAGLTPAFLYFRRPHPALVAAQFGDITLTVSGQGTVRATVYSASFGVSGTVAQIAVAPGQRVRAGDTLASLDPTAANLALSDSQRADSDAQATLTAAQTEYTDAQAALTSAQTALSSAQSASSAICGAATPDANACSESQADVDAATAHVSDAQVALDAATTRQAMAQTALDRAQEALDAAQAALAAATLVAPHDGVVLLVNGQVGDEVGVAGAPFITLADTAHPLATVMVGYRDILSVEPGEPATLRVSETSGAKGLRGSVYGYTLEPQGAGDSLEYPVTIAIDPASLSGANLLPGMSARATITTRSRAEVVIVPERAIAYARQAAPASGKGLLKAAVITDALQSASNLESLAVSGGLDTAHDPPQATYLLGFDHGKYIAIPVVIGLSDGHNREVILGLEADVKVVFGQLNPFVSV
ncbi:MAG TPA: HlyD family efflux transporter periplasmic adaptor subunit [Ktedonobacterales bacterium]